MAKKKAKVEYLGDEKVTYGSGPSWDFIYETSTVINPAYNIGDRVVLPDGRVFRYAKSGAACNSGLGVAFYNADPAISGNPAAAQAVGATSITFASQTFTLDQLRGGFIIIGFGSTNQVRGIIGNTAATSSTVTIYLDGALTTAITTSTYIEVCYSPYSDLRGGNLGGAATYAGIPAAQVTAASMYFWVQTWGPMWASPQASVQNGAYVRNVYWRHDGSLDVRANIGSSVNDQLAGVVVGRGTTQGPPLIMLQINP